MRNNGTVYFISTLCALITLSFCMTTARYFSKDTASETVISSDIDRYVQADVFRKELAAGNIDMSDYCRGSLVAEGKDGAIYDIENNTCVGSAIRGVAYYLEYEVGDDDKVYITDVEYPISYDGSKYMDYVRASGCKELPFGSNFSDKNARQYFDEETACFYKVIIPNTVNDLPVAGISSDVAKSLNAAQSVCYEKGGAEVKVIDNLKKTDTDLLGS